MATPRVFVSSTFYDLRYIRENLKYFIKSVGYEPVLSEEGSVYYDPKAEVREAAVAEVPSCQMLVLIIGGRYGQHIKPESDQSVTNAEYKKAAESNVPIFALVERDIYEQYKVYRQNKENPQIDAAAIRYPAVDSVKVFGFIEEVQGQAVNNALVPFADFGEIESYLRQQWASMMFSFLSSGSEARRVADTLDAVTEVSEKIEYLTREVVRSVGDPATKAAVKMYDILLADRLIADLAVGGAKPTPEAVLKNETLTGYFEDAGMEVGLESNAEYARSLSGRSITFDEGHFDSLSEQYTQLREALIDKSTEYGLTVDEYLARESN